MMSDQWQRALEAARKQGEEAGRNAAAWWQQDTIGGRTTGDPTPTARRVLAGIDDGDPAIIDALPMLDLSGQWADGPTVGSVLAKIAGPLPLELDEQITALGADDADTDSLELADELVDAFRDAYVSAALDECARMCRLVLEGENTDARPLGRAT